MSKKDYLGFFRVDERGTTIWKNLDQLKKFMSELPSNEYMIKISVFKEDRSIDQNRYYWKLLEIIANEIGYEPEEMHEVYKFKFLKKTIQDTNGNLIKGVGSTRKLKVNEFTDYLNNIKKHASELNITIPESFK